MRALFTMEHGVAAYRADFAWYGGVVLALVVLLLVSTPSGQGLAVSVCIAAGLAAWTLLEYVLHRCVLHGLEPFKGWHEEHHRRPVALICSPTVVSASLLFTLVFLPAWAVAGLWNASALTLGTVSGYLAYAITHHATHHWRADSAWLKRRKRWHALHHHGAAARSYGVTSAFWDHVFGSAGGRS